MSVRSERASLRPSPNIGSERHGCRPLIVSARFQLSLSLYGIAWPAWNVNTLTTLIIILITLEVTTKVTLLLLNKITNSHNPTPKFDKRGPPSLGMLS